MQISPSCNRSLLVDFVNRLTDTPQALLLSAEARLIEVEQQRLHPHALIRKAAMAIAEKAKSLVTAGSRIAVLAGPGNNGNDAVLAAEMLRQAGLTTILSCLPDALPSALPHYGGLRQDEPDYLAPLVIDGLFGHGLNRPVEGTAARWIAMLNRPVHPARNVLSIDVPSGLNADTGELLGETLKSTHTLAFLASKPGLLMRDGPAHAGIIDVDSLGLTIRSRGETVQPASFLHAVPGREGDVHKGTYGSLGVIAGSPGMMGAALLCARAALYMGAGKVLLERPPGSTLEVDPVHPEIMIVGPQSTSAMTAWVMGCGLGRQADTAMRMIAKLGDATPLLLDADALFALATVAPMAQAYRRRLNESGDLARTILTPHPLEAARLLETSVQSVQSDRVAAACLLAKRFNACAVLKGAGTVIAQPDGRYRVNTSGNAGLSSGGTGDVLAGMVGALLAQGMPSWDAAAAGVHLHGLAADFARSQFKAPCGLTATELAPLARDLLNCLVQCGNRA